MNLKTLRKSKNLTQSDMGKILNITAPTYNGYETEKYEPNIETLCKLADFYNVSLDYLVGREFNNDIGFLTEELKNVMYVIKKLNSKEASSVLTYALKLLDDQK